MEALLVYREQAAPSMAFPEFQRADSNSSYSGKGGHAETGRSGQETTVQPWERAWFHLKGYTEQNL